MDWEEVYYKQLKPPIIPKVSYEGDTRNFDDYPETVKLHSSKLPFLLVWNTLLQSTAGLATSAKCFREGVQNVRGFLAGSSIPHQ